jgi:Uma2 family endonuclease
MKAVMLNVPEHILEWRRRTGADRYDEMWDGVLHMASVPNREHQDFVFSLAMWLRLNWAKPNGCRIHLELNIAEEGAWPDNYRIPDLVLLTPSRFHIDCNEFFDGGPDAVVEIHSPGDEAYEKLEFYAKVGVLEVWIIDRDSKRPEIFELIGSEYRSRDVDAGGWLRSIVTGVEFRATTGDTLEIRVAGQDDTLARLP